MSLIDAVAGIHEQNVAPACDRATAHVVLRGPELVHHVEDPHHIRFVLISRRDDLEGRKRRPDKRKQEIAIVAVRVNRRCPYVPSITGTLVPIRRARVKILMPAARLHTQGKLAIEVR